MAEVYTVQELIQGEKEHETPIDVAEFQIMKLQCIDDMYMYTKCPSINAFLACQKRTVTP